MPILFDAGSWTLSLGLWSLQKQQAKSQELFVVLDTRFPLLPLYNTIMAVLLSRVLLYQDLTPWRMRWALLMDSHLDLQKHWGFVRISDMHAHTCTLGLGSSIPHRLDRCEAALLLSNLWPGRYEFTLALLLSGMFFLWIPVSLRQSGQNCLPCWCIQ